MIPQLWEALFCPVHGMLRPANWVFIAPALTGVGFYLRSALHAFVNSASVRHFENLRRMGVL